MKIETSNNTLTIQLRYYFKDENLHSMNAEVFNECERQFIKAIKSTEKYLEEALQIKIKPREEGSLAEFIEAKAIFNENTKPLVIVVARQDFDDLILSETEEKTDETNKVEYRGMLLLLTSGLA